MNEATKYNRAKTWQIALFALNMMSTNMYWLYRSGNSHNFCTDFTYKRSKTETDLRFLYRLFYAVLTDRNYNACFQLPCSEIWRNDT